MALHATHRREAAQAVHTLPSLLWPPSAAERTQLSPETAADLDLEPLVAALSGRESDRARFVTGVLTELPAGAPVIGYRADTLTNLLDEPELRARLEALLPMLAKMARERRRPIFGIEWSAAQIVDRLGDLELYVEAALELESALEGAGIRAPGLLALRSAVSELTGTPEFLALREELPTLREQLDAVQSVTIGVNVTRDLRPESAAILSIDDRKIEGRNGLLGRLLGREAAKAGITRLRGGSGASFRGFFPPMAPNSLGYENDLVRDLQRLMDRVVTPLGEAIERYVWAQTRDFVILDAELHFLLGAATLTERLRRAGLPMCRPEIAPPEERICTLDEAYNITLALRTLGGGGTAIVTNNVTFEASVGRVWILTGPNRGGKTTYARAVGLAHLLAQAGLYVPARTACVSPVDGIWTHFPTLEKGKPGEGRLDDEAIRLADIFRAATPHSLILLNEVMTGTSTVEALGLAYDAVRGLRLLGARAIYVTHLHELADRADEINAGTCGDGTVSSLVAEVDAARSESEAHRRTFRIRPSPPLGVSYASEIAEQHGISYPQLLELLRSRGVIGQ